MPLAHMRTTHTVSQCELAVAEILCVLILIKWLIRLHHGYASLSQSVDSAANLSFWQETAQLDVDLPVDMAWQTDK